MTKVKAVELYTIYKHLCVIKKQAVLFDLQDFIDSDIELKTKEIVQRDRLNEGTASGPKLFGLGDYMGYLAED